VETRLLVVGEPEAVRELAANLHGLVPGIVTLSVEEPWALPERADATEPAVVLLLRGPIASHDERLRAIESLRSGGFRGPVLVEGSFLSERSDAVAAGADYVFTPPKQAAEKVVAAALQKVRVAADHAYLQALLIGEWATVAPFGEEFPAVAPDILLVSTSLRPAGSAFHTLADWSSRHSDCRIVIVEDGAEEDVAAEALSVGSDHYVELAEDGVGALLALGRRLAREVWLARVAAA